MSRLRAESSGRCGFSGIFLFAVIQLYEFLLIAAAGFLVHKVGLILPAVILTLLEGVFLFDCTFRLETISHLGLIGTVMSIMWVALVPVIGMGSWLTFDVVVARSRRAQCPPAGGARSTVANARWWTCGATPGKIPVATIPGIEVHEPSARIGSWAHCGVGSNPCDHQQVR